MKVDEALQDVQILGFDTAPIIYFVEANPHYDAVVASIFRSVSQGVVSGVTSTITLTEVLIHPLRKGETELSAKYRTLLIQSAHFHMIAIDEGVAERAAQLRAEYNIRTPDAL